MVAIPARDEEDRIEACLTALALQEDAPPFGLVLVLNNCQDGTQARVQALQPRLPYPLELVAVDLEPERAHVGQARRLAMDRAAELAGPGGVILTTDADGEAAPDWIAANVAALAGPVDAVAGVAVVLAVEDPDFPIALHEDNIVEEAYRDLLDLIEHEVEPRAHDPLPRHTQQAGASIAVSVETYEKAGGLPVLPFGEDRAFFGRLAAIDARVRHAPEARVRVSGRVVGRAAGGMADTIRRRMTICQDPFLDPPFEPIARYRRRLAWRQRLRQALALGGLEGVAMAGLCRRLLVDRDRLLERCAGGGFGLAWTALEAESPLLARVPMARADLPSEIVRAERLLARLRARRQPGDGPARLVSELAGRLPGDRPADAPPSPPRAVPDSADAVPCG